MGTEDSISHARSKWRHLLHSLGVELLPMLDFGSCLQERPKPVLQTSRTLAWFSCGVHILPICTSIVMVSMNLKGYYCGFLTGKIVSLAINIALLQIAAKLQELLIVASLTTIIVHSIRAELITGEGVPLGILGSSFLFTSLSYFWSPPFWGALKAKAPLSTKVRLYTLLVLCGIVAATAGPSSAILMVPRSQTWHAGGGLIYLPGNASTLWPDEVSIDSSVSDFCQVSNATEIPICLSTSYLTFKQKARSELLLRNVGGSQWNSSTEFLFGERTIDLPSQLSVIPGLFLHGTPRAAACHTAAIGVDLREGILLYQLHSDWRQTVFSRPFRAFQPSVSEYKYAYSTRADSQTKTKVPAVRVACSSAQNLSSSAYQVKFPILPVNSCPDQATSLHDVSLNKKSTNRIQSRWSSLPQTFQAANTGLVIEAPWDNATNTRPVVGCSIDARWALGMGCIEPEARANGNIYQSTPGTTGFESSSFRPPSDGSWTRIGLHLSFLQALTPPMTLIYGNELESNISTLDWILESMGIATGLTEKAQTQTQTWNDELGGGINRTVSIEWTLAALIADGLSRQGSARMFNTSDPLLGWSPRYYERKPDFENEVLSGKEPLKRPESDSVIEDQVVITIQGYSFSANAVTDYLAVAVLLTHVCLALGHTILIVRKSQSSSSWDTLTELLVLMLNSPPSKAFMNTGAGIMELSTYSHKARIQALKAPNGSADEPASIEAVFENGEDDSYEMHRLLATSEQLGGDNSVPSPDLTIASERAKTWPFFSANSHTRNGHDPANRNLAQGSLANRIIEQVRADVAYG